MEKGEVEYMKENEVCKGCYFYCENSNWCSKFETEPLEGDYCQFKVLVLCLIAML